MAETLVKIRALKELGVHAWPLDTVALSKQQAYVAHVQMRRPSMTARIERQRQTVEITCFLRWCAESGHVEALTLRAAGNRLPSAQAEHRQRRVCRPRVDKLPSMHPLIETHRDELLALARRRGITGVRVFGSMSRGDVTDRSDVDLLVTLSPGTSALALGGLLLDAQELLGRRVDVVTEASLHPALRESVIAGAVPL